MRVLTRFSFSNENDASDSIHSFSSSPAVPAAKEGSVAVAASNKIASPPAVPTGLDDGETLGSEQGDITAFRASLGASGTGPATDPASEGNILVAETSFEILVAETSFEEEELRSHYDTDVRSAMASCVRSPNESF